MLAVVKRMRATGIRNAIIMSGLPTHPTIQDYYRLLVQCPLFSMIDVPYYNIVI